MKEIVGDIWDYHRRGAWIVVPTNGSVKTNGEAVMGRGLALQAKRKYPDVPKKLGESIRVNGNIVCQAPSVGLIFFPVKHKWFEVADLKLIEKSAKELKDAVGNRDETVFLPRVGCGNGKLDWKDVKPILEKYLNDDRFVVVSREVDS